MQTVGRLIAAVCLLLLLVMPAVHGEPDGPATLEQIMAALRSVRHVEARYIEHHYLHALRTPIESRGTLRFDAPAHLEKAADPNASGAVERLTIDGDRLTIDRGKSRPPIVISVQEHPEIATLVDSLRAILSGNGEALRHSFEVTASGTVDEWALVLKPRDVSQRGLLQWMQVHGYGERITAIDTMDGEGDRSEMSVVELKR